MTISYLHNRGNFVFVAHQNINMLDNFSKILHSTTVYLDRTFHLIPKRRTQVTGNCISQCQKSYLAKSVPIHNDSECKNEEVTQQWQLTNTDTTVTGYKIHL